MEADTKGSASFNTTSILGECYIRPYLVVFQNGEKHKEALGTYLCQTPSDSFDGKTHGISVDAYTPLTELQEKNPPIGYSVSKGQNVLDIASNLTKENLRAPVIAGKGSETLPYEFVANIDDTWLDYLSDMLAYGKCTYGLDDLGRIIFVPNQDINSLQPVWTFTDDDESILYPEFKVDKDLYGIPNVLEVIYSAGNTNLYSRVVNDSIGSPISTVNRGREIVYRDTDPELSGTPNQEQLDVYARNKLKQLSSLEYTLTYSHGYCPVRVGDCVRLDYDRENLHVKARVTRQSISCVTGCTVEETAVYTENLWE